MTDIQATIHTAKGEIPIILYADKTPITVANFVNLAKRGFYSPNQFHRVVPNFANRMKTSNQANVKLVVLEDAGHFFRDLFGEDLADSIADFMNNHEHSTQN